MPTKGLDSLSAKLARIPRAILEATQKANEANADDFMAQVRTNVPKGDRTPQLVDTLAKGPGKTPYSVEVSIGGPEAPYPAHLEFGHMAGGDLKGHGVHVRAEPFWFTTLRVNKRRFRDRRARAARNAIKAMSV